VLLPLPTCLHPAAAASSRDYAPFDVDTTTARPASFAGNARIMIGGKREWYSATPVGGVSYTGAFVDTFCFVFPENLGPK
jgi:hypothetical protein